MTISGMLRVGALALGALLVVPAVAAAQTAEELLQQRVARLEALIIALTGQIDGLTLHVQELELLVARLQEDYLRLQQLAVGGGAGLNPPGNGPSPLRIDLGAAFGPPAVPEAATPPPAGAAPETPAAPLAQNPPVSLVPPAPVAEGAVPALAPPATVAEGAAPLAGPLDLGAILRGDGATDLPGPGIAAAVTTGDPLADYVRAYQLILLGEYPLAETGFRAFLSAYADHPLSTDAQYWLGESLFMRGIHTGAAEAFLATYQADPQGEKAPDSLLKLGMSLVALGQVADGCASFAQVLSQFPNASNSLRQRVTAEQTNARCP